jgi:carotenoid 1,2-hydratase
MGGGDMRDGGPDFSIGVPLDGYAWWYVDAISDDGAHALTVIGFIGSVFSPYYKWARRKGPADPFDHCAINVALYGPRARWSMTERGEAGVWRSASHLAIGPSALRWENDALTILINERAAPLPFAMGGRIRVHPQTLFNRAFALDPTQRHRWLPYAPLARVEVEMTSPGLRWSGAGYFDHNCGSEPLEAGFTRWDWARAHGRGGATIHYDSALRDGAQSALALRFAPDGRIEDAPAPPRQPMRRAPVWRMARAARCDDGAAPKAQWTLVDAPFYARSVISTTLDGEAVTGVHESVDLDRFTAPIVQMMLPFRMPRLRR